MVLQSPLSHIGTVATIYESRPNVTVDIAAICIKTNNVCILKGGKEAINSNIALVRVCLLYTS